MSLERNYRYINKGECPKSFRQVANNSESGLRTVERVEKVNGRTFTFYDIYEGSKLIAIE